LVISAYSSPAAACKNLVIAPKQCNLGIYSPLTLDP